MVAPLALYAGPIPTERDPLQAVAIVRAQWDPHATRQTYGPRLDAVRLVEDPAAAEFLILPFGWPANAPHTVTTMQRLAQQHHTPIIVWEGGDLPSDLPLAPSVHVHGGLHRSRRTAERLQWARPSFVSDYLASHYGGQLTLREKGPQPLVGFCGHVLPTLSARSAAYFGRALWQRLQRGVGRFDYVPTALPPHTVLRARTLNHLQKAPGITTDFILRSQYRAGSKNLHDDQREKIEFLDNITHTDYTVCVRGYGNFSTRLYETLALGRIPLFINTDCVLPFENHIDWHALCIWVEESDLPRIGEIVRQAHHDTHPDDFRQRQLDARRIWETYLTPHGFYTHLPLMRTLTQPEAP